jgi:hypothetical protein
MAYFSKFPKTLYSFGDGKVALAQNLTVYAEIIDELKQNSAYYKPYNIITGERPDQVAFKLYKDPNLYWTLFLLNDTLREKGWPLDHSEVIQKAKKDFPDYVIHTHDEIFDKLQVGESIICTRSGLHGDIVYRNLKNGDITITNLRKLQGDTYVPVLFSDTDIREGDEIRSINTDETIIAEYFTPEYYAARHHIDSDGNIVDYLPFTGVGEDIERVTNLEYYTQENDKLKQINVIKPIVITKVVSAFNDSVRS